MDDLMKILIVEDDDAEALEIKECVESEPGMEVAACVNNEKDALRVARDFYPHTIILDIELHNGGGNGISFLSELKKMKLPVSPYILVTTYNTAKPVIKQIRSHGNVLVLSKNQTDYCAQTLIEHLKMMKTTIFSSYSSGRKEGADIAEEKSQAEKNSRLKAWINSEFDLIEMYHRLSGRRYLVETLILMKETGLSDKEVRGLVAKAFKKDDNAIYQAMNNSIKRTWNTTATETLEKYYKGVISSETGAPSVTEFLYYYFAKL